MRSTPLLFLRCSVLRGLLERNDHSTFCKPQVLAVFCSISLSKRRCLTARNPTFLGHSVIPPWGWDVALSTHERLSWEPRSMCPQSLAAAPGRLTGRNKPEVPLPCSPQALLSPPQLTVCVWERSIPRPSYSRVGTNPALCPLQSQGQAQSGT